MATFHTDKAGYFTTTEYLHDSFKIIGQYCCILYHSMILLTIGQSSISPSAAGSTDYIQRVYGASLVHGVNMKHLCITYHPLLLQVENRPGTSLSFSLSRLFVPRCGGLHLCSVQHTAHRQPRTNVTKQRHMKLDQQIRHKHGGFILISP